MTRFVAHTVGRKFELFRNPIRKCDFGALPWLGWSFVEHSLSHDEAVRDMWDESFAQIIGYVEETGLLLDWRNGDGDPVDLRALQPSLDSSDRWTLAIHRSLGDDQRACVNQFDSGEFRFTVEQQRLSNGMEWWEPISWSKAFDSAAEARVAMISGAVDQPTPPPSPAPAPSPALPIGRRRGRLG